ncbi:MAG: hypothetical protein US83_C0006G0067 [Candidatus Falkowbacteria bacterium GW2011_GWC2_38_22]|uniref:Uncharacterized protein n=1 Tax=Candidatus Falkowbacteria bacterium GW2011_GWE1_38_31 TaxID=1618638 RepID=A0A0G0JUD1_9BACT|nr:MAG: hypothetical protein US73_C0001G0020 [Candidatus Falkowbacteria bacterium GW2011_GWF2_38_1205]KKQ61427.1 MAG: hypothetical protein US83_C0006G0067 [Candidatus Falkowbacteria bacterium GW2011_GWC2_38_22]KKQ63988.1 MAG: hypothetical protein US84_C0002G0020 [Candidatus Falkowbacteria bacterium GW2011_GWF1_38_22]KKQ66664.1 MAG: hypothetical protein US87_C0001G0185 [Candidatus Falkowbacteria bacterium GW2011_GWE2_38_254]KKQ71093.1 MAG: hypothetical protein US91_C0001G0020 [Candidatus Falkowb
MIKGGSRVKKNVEKKAPKKVSLTVKVDTSPRKTRAKTAGTEIKSAHVFDKPEDIKKKKEVTRKKLITWKKKKTDNGFIQSGVEKEVKENVTKTVVTAKIENNYKPESKARPAVIISQRTEADKKLIMWSGIGFFMVIIFVIWIFQIKQTIIQAKIEDNGDSTEDISMMLGDVTEKIGQMKVDLDKIRNYNETVATGTAEVDLVLRDKIEELVEDIASSTVQATSTVEATSTEAEIVELKKKLELINN